MKPLAMLSLILLTGCAAKHHVPHDEFVLPINCITRATATGECKEISENEAVCNGVVVKFQCVKAKEK